MSVSGCLIEIASLLQGMPKLKKICQNMGDYQSGLGYWEENDSLARATPPFGRKDESSIK